MSDPKVRPFLMFEGQAEEAMNFDMSLFPSAKIEHIDRYGPQGPGKEGSCPDSDVLDRGPGSYLYG